MKANFKQLATSLGLLILLTLQISAQQFKPSDIFGAYYTNIKTGADWEIYDRTGDYADIIVDLGKENGKFVFWRGASYLPYWENASGQKFYVNEIVPRTGDGNDLMPDRVNTYSHVALIENTDEVVTVHWRYLPSFAGSNPHIGVMAINFVDEYFAVYPNGEVIRTIHKGREKIIDWNDPQNLVINQISLSQGGIIEEEISSKKSAVEFIVVEGAPVVEEVVVTPVAWFKFDEAISDVTEESIGGASSKITGDRPIWKKGISGTSLQFDGYKTTVEIPSSEGPKPTDAITLEGWIALGAYPWNWCPIIQQADDVPEEVRLFRGEYDITDVEKREGDLSVGVIGGDPENPEGDVIEVEEIDYDEIEFSVKYLKEDDTGYFLGIDGHGHPGFKIRVGGIWEELTCELKLERKTWYHIAATFSASNGKMMIYVNGKLAGEKVVAKKAIELSEKNIQIGRGKERRPTDPVRENTFPGTYSLDGLVDEIKVYDVALSPQQISTSFGLYDIAPRVDLDQRKLPAGENRQTFGAYYTNLSFYDSWDNMWRFGEHSDVVVEFEDNPCKFIFWKGVSYIPMMVNDNDYWYSNEFNETWSTSGGEGCQEPMSDKQCLYNHVRIIENTPARTLVHYRFPLVDVNKIKANFVEESGWYDVADWYYYVYPDGIAAKIEHLWTSGDRIHEWQESMAIFGPDQHPHDLIEREATFTIVRIDSSHISYDWNPLPPDGIDDVEGANIHYVNYKGNYDPVTIVDDIIWSNVYGGEITNYAIFPTWNHWPVAQMPSDGRYASHPDRTSHSSLSHIYWPNYDEQYGNRPYQEKILLEGMVNKAPLELIPLAKSWIHPPTLHKVKGCTGKYDRAQRAYVLETESENMSMTILATEEKPVVNLCLVFNHWNSINPASVAIDGIQINCRQGIVKDTDGSNKLIVWIEKQSTRSVNIEIEKLRH